MTDRCRLSAAEQDQIRAWALAGIGPAEIARRLGQKQTAIIGTLRRLVRAGQITRQPRPAWRPWTPRDCERLAMLIETGHSYDQIARKLGRTKTAILLAVKRHRTGGVRTTDATLSATDVAERLGIGCPKTVVRWIRRRWLKARNAGSRACPLWRIALLDLYDFLENDAYWMAWHPALIRDADLRAWATELRAGRPAWLSIGAVAARLHVGASTVQSWIVRGELPATRYGNHWIRETDLIGFVVPGDRPRAVWRPRGWPRDGWADVGRVGGVTVRRRRAAA